MIAYDLDKSKWYEMNPRKCFFANLMVLTKQDNLREVMNLGKVEEKFEKKNIFIKDFDLNRKKTNYKGVIYVTTIHRDIEHVEKFNIIIEASVH